MGPSTATDISISPEQGGWTSLCALDRFSGMAGIDHLDQPVLAAERVVAAARVIHRQHLRECARERGRRILTRAVIDSLARLSAADQVLNEACLARARARGFAPIAHG